MRYLVTAKEMQRYDANTIETIGIPGMVLMERAALAAADFLKERFEPRDGRVLIMAGMGNNGADGLAVARILSEAGFSVDVWQVGDPARASEEWRRQNGILRHYPVKVCDARQPGEYTILVDALFGVGLTRDVKDVWADAVNAFNARAGFKLSLDVPSGVDSDTGCVLGCAVKADATMTFGLCKRGLLMYPGHLLAGELYVADIGISERSFLGETPGMFCYDSVGEGMPARDPAGHKGTFGKVLLAAGNDKMAGAAVLAAKAAYRAGAGMVKVISHENNRAILQESVPEALFGTCEDLEESMRWADVLAVGPGLGTAEEAGQCLKTMIRGSAKPLVIDADGLNLLASDLSLRVELADQKRAVILTPHAGELSRLTGVPVSDLKSCLCEWGALFSEQMHAVVVAKDARTFICAEGRPVCMNLFGNSGMATAGSGDVLTGVIAGLLAQILGGGTQDEEEAVFRAACQGAALHGAAGDAAAARTGEYACMAGDIAEALADVLRESDVDQYGRKVRYDG